MSKFFATICVSLLMCVGTAFAASSGPSTHKVRLNIKGTAQDAPSADVDTANGNACNVATWVDYCPSGDCQCMEVTGAKAAGKLDKGRVTISNFFVTVDLGLNPATEPTVGNGPNPNCNFFLGVATAASASSGNTETVNLIGTTCKHVIAVSHGNPSGTHNKDLILGGWGISDAPPPTPTDASGWGTLSGNINQKSGGLSMKVTGMITQ